jgi:hypothetical protein
VQISRVLESGQEIEVGLRSGHQDIYYTLVKESKNLSMLELSERANCSGFFRFSSGSKGRDQGRQPGRILGGATL